MNWLAKCLIIIWATFFSWLAEVLAKKWVYHCSWHHSLSHFSNPGLLLKPSLTHTQTLAHIYTHMHTSHTNIHIALYLGFSLFLCLYTHTHTHTHTHTTHTQMAATEEPPTTSTPHSIQYCRLEDDSFANILFTMHTHPSANLLATGDITGNINLLEPVDTSLLFPLSDISLGIRCVCVCHISSHVTFDQSYSSIQVM